MRGVCFVICLALWLGACTASDKDSTTRDASPPPSASPAASGSPGDAPPLAGERTCTPPVLDVPGPTVSVFLIDENEIDPYHLDSYREATRPISRAQAAAPVRAALTELFSGTTAAEERGNCAGIFTRHNRDLLLGLALEDGRLVVDLKDLHEEGLGHASASHAGAVFLTQILATLGQFSEVETVFFEMEGSCEDFYELMQIGVCKDLDVRRPGSS